MRPLQFRSRHLQTKTPQNCLRMIVDICNFSAKAKADSHPVPVIEEKIAKRARGDLFSVLHLRHGFHQMPLKKDSRPLTHMWPCPVDGLAHGTEE